MTCCNKTLNFNRHDRRLLQTFYDSLSLFFIFRKRSAKFLLAWRKLNFFKSISNCLIPKFSGWRVNLLSVSHYHHTDVIVTRTQQNFAIAHLNENVTMLWVNFWNIWWHLGMGIEFSFLLKHISSQVCIAILL